MASSLKIVWGDGGVSGHNEFEMVYNAASQADLKLLYGSSVEQKMADIVFHNSDNSTPRPVRAIDPLKQFYATMNVLAGDDWDAVINELAPLKRLLDGADSAALRQQISDDENPVYARIQLDAATNYTQFRVVAGVIDDSLAYTRGVSIINEIAFNVVVSLLVEPPGRGAASVLHNDLPSSPHMLEDTNADGLADGLTSSGTPSVSINTGQYLVGGASQSVNCSAVGLEYIQTATVSVLNNGYVIVSLWMVVGSGTVYIMLRNTTSGSDAVEKQLNTTDSNNVSDREIIGANGETWRRVAFVHRNTTGGTKSYAIRIHNNSAAVVFYVDALYLQNYGLSPAAAPGIPDGFCSASSVFSRQDPGIDTDYINYYDLALIPGDMPALLKLYGSATAYTNNPKIFIISKITDGLELAKNFTIWLESDELTTIIDSGGNAWTTRADATRSNGDYEELAGGVGSIAAHTGRAYYRFTDDAARRFARYYTHVFLLYRTNHADTVVNCFVASFSLSNKVADLGNISLPNTSSVWSLANLGGFTLRGFYPDEVPDTTKPGGQGCEFNLSFSGLTNGDEVEIDAVIFHLSAGDDHLLFMDMTDSDSSAGFQANPEPFEMVSGQAGTRVSALGKITTITPGTQMTRLYLTTWGDNVDADVHVLTNNTTFTATVTPCASHLLGTI